MSWECPSKGKSKGGIKGKGDGKGKGKNTFSKGSFIKGSLKGNFQNASKGTSKGSKGKGPATGCWTCGGPHYADKCPNINASVRVLEGHWDEHAAYQGGILSSLKSIESANLIEKLSVFEHRNSFQLLSVGYQDDSDDICNSPDMTPSDDEADDQHPKINDSDIDNTESLRVFIKHTIKELAAAESSDSDEFQSTYMDIQGKCGHQDFQMIGKSNKVLKDSSIILRDLDNEWDALKQRQKAKGICSKTVDIQWKKLIRRHREQRRHWEILRQMVPGNEVPAIRARRGVQRGHEGWVCRIYADLAKEKSSEARTWSEILDDLDVEEAELKQVEVIDMDEGIIKNHQKSFKQTEVHPCYVCVAIEPEGYNSVIDGEWEEVELAVDSGATETVIDANTLTHVKAVEGPAFKRGVKYEVANGVRIPNLGEKKFKGFTEEGTLKNITAQVCDVNKPLLSVSKVVAAGNRVVFDKDGSYIEDIITGDKVWLKNVGGMYMLKLWVKRDF